MPIPENILKALEGNENKDTLIKEYEAHEASIIDEAGKASSQKANNEAKGVRARFKKAWDELGLDPDSSEFEANLLAHKNKVAELEKKGDDDSEGENAQIRLLEASLADITGKFDASQKTALKEKTSRRKTKLSKTISELLVKEGAHSPEIVTSHLMNQISLDGIDGETFNPTFVHNDVDVDLSTGVSNYLKANPAQVKNETTPGGDSGADNGGERKAPNSDDMKTRLAESRARDAARQVG